MRIFLRIRAELRFTRPVKFAARNRTGRRPNVKYRYGGNPQETVGEDSGSQPSMTATPRSNPSRSPAVVADALYGAPGSTIKAGGGLGTPDFTE
jgi:hypothetical protein